MSDKRVWILVTIVIVVIVVIVYTMTRPTIKAALPVQEVSPRTDPSSTTQVIIPPPVPVPPSAQTTFKQIYTGGYWSSEQPQQYTCPDAQGRNTSGNNGDYGNYCIFDNQSDAELQCAKDSKCRGYVGKTGTYQLLTTEPVQNATANGFFYGSSRFY